MAWRLSVSHSSRPGSRPKDCRPTQGQLIMTPPGCTDLGGGGAGEAVAHEHSEGVACTPQQLHSLGVCEAKQALLVHLQQPQPHSKAAITPGCSCGAHLQEPQTLHIRTGCPGPPVCPRDPAGRLSP